MTLLSVENINTYINDNPEYKPLLYDILRLLTIQIISQLLFTINNSEHKFLSERFLHTLIYLLIGTLIFWLIIYKTLLSYKLDPLKL